MRLYLSSYHVGHAPDHLTGLVGDNKRVAVIVNASDGNTASVRDQQLTNQLDAMRALGFDPYELDLRQYFGEVDRLEHDLASFGLVWVKGGNAFVLKRAYEQSGFDHVITSFLTDDRIVYAGYSAGICVMGPTLKGLDLCDDPTTLPDGYTDELDWNGLHLVAYSILPHYKSDHPESGDIDRVVTYMTDHSLPFRTLHDGEAIVIHGNQELLVGQH